MPFNPSKWNVSIDRYINPWVPSPPWKHLPYPVAHFLGHRTTPQRPLGNVALAFWAFIGVFVSLLGVALIGRAIPSFQERGAPVIIGSFGAVAVLEFYAIESPLAQPRNSIFGQLIASMVGVSISKLFALNAWSGELLWLAGSLSCACATAIMALTGTVHPPGGATALLAVVNDDVAKLGWFLFPVIILSCILMKCVALLLNNIQRSYPSYWWSPEDVGQNWHAAEESDRQSHPDIQLGSKVEHSSSQDRDDDMTSDAHYGSKLIIERGKIVIPDDVFLTFEEKNFLEEISAKLQPTISK
ncbi:HPP family-domain-containing protein [Pseudomassariella vexata]|uniref:HPP family-domain-containing protein n=1 Tax=Pseudomassariella vexata TaxID=1141098 RepID=A0A1Y2EFM8_9PEZI|nr:HPP family-domain-containing protein [Pseudomassariella vexata]ORY70388.1 HPP family-domain-containing protein [Pseudomassariella vexata]